jgi:putative GTP pyrophosphokinase
MSYDYPWIEELREEYIKLKPQLDRFATELTRQLSEMLEQEKVPLGVPVQSRVKGWDSLQGKLERKERELDSVVKLTDLIGLRVITLFQEGVDAVCRVLNAKFQVLEEENTQGRLEESQFGYLSMHFIVQCLPEWYSIPTFASFRDLGLGAEIQVRTLAQHTWADASRHLQYNQEDKIPPPVRRTLYRLSALLETVDLEFTRLLDQRNQYQNKVDVTSEEQFDVDSLAKVLDAMLPPDNKDIVEEYVGLLDDLLAFHTTDSIKLKDLWTKHQDAVIEYDTQTVEAVRDDNDLQKLLAEDAERLQKGVFFTHVGLIRLALRYEFGDRWVEYWDQKEVDEDGG